VPEFAELVGKAMHEATERATGEIAVKRARAHVPSAWQVASERGEDGSGFVVTFDDITDLVSAQRTAAWPMSRAASRTRSESTDADPALGRALKRKYAKEISTDKEVFEQCTDTIIARWAISDAWSTSSPLSPACRRR